MKTARIIRKAIGVVFLMAAMLLICAADTPCSTWVFLTGYAATVLFIVAGAWMIAPKEVKAFVRELKADLK